MDTEKITPEIAKQRMVTSLRIAEEAWKEAALGRIFEGQNYSDKAKETGKIALAMLAREIFKVVT